MKRIVFTLITALLLTATLTAAAQDAPRRYGIKSGIIKLISSTAGVDTPETQYFDDYGAKESIVYTTDIPGVVKYDNWVITIGNTMYGVSVTEDKRNYGKPSENPVPDLTFNNPSPEVTAKYNIKELGEEKFLDRNCKIFSYETTQRRTTITHKVWIYKGVILKQQSKIRNRDVLIYATDFQENVAIPAYAFQIKD
jgi:hypothetical protein